MFKYLFLLLLSFNAVADEWSQADTNREAVYMVFHVADWAQTRNAARNPDKWYESNPILGKYPSQEKIDLYFISTAFLHYVAAKTLSGNYRSAFQYITIGAEANQVRRNLQVGVAIKF